MHNFKKKSLACFWLKILSFVLIFGILAAIFNFFTDPYYSWRHYGSYKDKLENLQKIDGEKTVFIGGSSVLFGVNAEHYQKISGKQAINMGLHALESPDIYLTCVEPYINKGDTVVIALEYYAYTSADAWSEYDDVGLDVAHLSKEYYKVVPLKNRINYCYRQFLRSFEKGGLRLYVSTIEKIMMGTELTYLRENINSYGDLDKGISDKSKSPGEQIDTLILNRKCVSELQKYISAFQQKGAQIYIVFPPSYNKSTTGDEKNAFLNEMKTAFGDIVLGSPSDWMKSNSAAFFDTGYHLIYSESIKHTDYIYDLINSL